MRPMVHVAMLVLVVGLTAGGAEEAPPASGQLMVAGTTIAPVQAVAMWTVSTAAWNAGEKVLQVIMAPSPISTADAGRALDPYDAVRGSIDGDFVVVTLSAQGVLQMVYAYVAEGSQNFGFGTGGKAEVKIGDGRVAGRVYTEGEESIGDTPIAFDLRFAIPILAERALGTQLGGGGGEPGAAYAALTAAERSGDVEVLKRHLPVDSAASLAEADEAYRGYIVDSMKEMAKREMTVTGGELFDGWAILTVKGKDWSGDSVEGKVKMEKDGGDWRLVEESLSTVW